MRSCHHDRDVTNDSYFGSPHQRGWDQVMVTERGR